MDRIEVGDVAKDSITGFEGVVTSRTEWLNGCIRLGLQPQQLHEGKPIPAEVFDEEQLVLVRKRVHALPPGAFRSVDPGRGPGGPRPDPIQRPNPTR